MNWVVFSYSLPSQSSSSPRVTLWRRLRRLGAISPAGGIYVLPAQGDCLESFQWLAQEIQQAQGQALVMHVQQFEGLTDQELINLFCEARQEDYLKIETQVVDLEQAITPELEMDKRGEGQEKLAKLQRHYADIVAIDYFACPVGRDLAARLAKLAQRLAPTPEVHPPVARVALEVYQDKPWVTRPQPHVDRLACIWLIRRFINPQAPIRYAFQPEPGEVSFDMAEADFAHTGNLCTFETMLRAFQVEGPGLTRLAEIVHEIDLRDERYFHPEAKGVESILKGWLTLNLPDAELEARGVALFEGLFAVLSSQA